MGVAVGVGHQEELANTGLWVTQGKGCRGGRVFFLFSAVYPKLTCLKQ